MIELSGLIPRTAAEVRKIRDCREWRDRVRPQQLLDFPYCQTCDKKGRLVEAVQVDHITPLEVGGLPFDQKNLQSLCKRCHTIKSAEEARRRNKQPSIINKQQ
ncbi:HNH endonuclease signature motif containing protein [Dyadobacter fermentans]|uniref:HNH endonuclease signature motif containing protein n=1 Tax=Dyadobacter fermentans TaxID=94254 RepID=UPI0009FEDC02